MIRNLISFLCKDNSGGVQYCTVQVGSDVLGSFHRHLESLGRLDLDCGDSDNVLLTIGPVRAQNPI